LGTQYWKLQLPVTRSWSFVYRVPKQELGNERNGSPAFRCIYVAKYLDTIVVLHAFVKTTNGIDRQAMKVADQRLKELLAGIKKTH
jgi:phage-related protein